MKQRVSIPRPPFEDHQPARCLSGRVSALHKHYFLRRLDSSKPLRTGSSRLASSSFSFTIRKQKNSQVCGLSRLPSEAVHTSTSCNCDLLGRVASRFDLAQVFRVSKARWGFYWYDQPLSLHREQINQSDATYSSRCGCKKKTGMSIYQVYGRHTHALTADIYLFSISML